MKTNILHLKHLFALLLSTLTFVACSSDNNELPTPADPDTSAADSVRFTAIFGVKNPTTRALTDPGDGTLTASGARAVMHPGKTSVQVVIGTKVQQVADAISKVM